MLRLQSCEKSTSLNELDSFLLSIETPDSRLNSMKNFNVLTLEVHGYM